MSNLYKYITGAFLFLATTAKPQQILKDAPIQISRISINVTAGCFSATTLLDINLFNPNSKILDGEYNFSLHDGQVVTGFALDINGHMRNGVIVDKQKGRVAYENTIRRRIDPGLLEMISPNNYRIRVYPMPANGTRTIRIRISEVLAVREDAVTYNLPVDIPYKTKQFDVKISASCAGQKPYSNFGVLKGKEFLADCDSFVLRYAGGNVEQIQNLNFSIPIPDAHPRICSKSMHDTTLFVLRAHPGVVENGNHSRKKLMVFWDVSSSTLNKKAGKEIDFLKKFCGLNGTVKLTVATFSNKIHEIKNFDVENKAFSDLDRFLQSCVPDGGTQLGVIDCKQYDADAFLLFSDGLSNYGSSEFGLSNKPVFCISSSTKTNQSLLKKLANNSNGRYIDLNTTEVDAAVQSTTTTQLKLTSVTSAGKLFLSNRLPIQVDRWVTIAGMVVGSNDLKLQFGDQGQISSEQTIRLDGNCSADLQNILPLEQYEALTDEESIFPGFCNYYGFVSESTSFIVLDNLSDYIDYGIEPPDDLQEAYRQQIYLVKKKAEDVEQQLANAQLNSLKNCMDLYNERIRWWDNEEATVTLDKLLTAEQKMKTGKLKPTQSSPNTNKTSPDNAPTTAEGLNIKNENGFFGEMRMQNAMQEVVVVTAMGVKRRPKELGFASTTVRSDQITNGRSTNVATALAGKVAGLTVYNINQDVTALPRLILRGNRSITGENQPLIVLDGAPVPYSMLQIINPNEVESVTVLKGGQGAVLYGSEGANGVILISRKRPTTTPPPQVSSGNDPKPQAHRPQRPSYLQMLIKAAPETQYSLYLQMRDSMQSDPGFYFECADKLFHSGNREQALTVLTNLVELTDENHQLLRAMGYMLESWGMCTEAIEVYKKVLAIKEEEPQSYRDLALAYEENGQHQQAVDLFYRCVTKSWFQYENRYRDLRGIMLNELNAIIARNTKQIDLSKINEELIRPLPVDLRVVIDWNKDETDMDLHIISPSGEECYFGHKSTREGGQISQDFTQGYGPEEFQLKFATGRYKIRVNYFGDRYQKQQTPSILKLTVYRNFGQPEQTVTTQTFVMDKQSGMIEIGELKF